MYMGDCAFCAFAPIVTSLKGAVYQCWVNPKFPILIEHLFSGRLMDEFVVLS